MHEQIDGVASPQIKDLVGYPSDDITFLPPCGRHEIILRDDIKINIAVFGRLPPGMAAKKDDFVRVQWLQRLTNLISQFIRELYCIA